MLGIRLTSSHIDAGEVGVCIDGQRGVVAINCRVKGEEEEEEGGIRRQPQPATQAVAKESHRAHGIMCSYLEHQPWQQMNYLR